MKLFLKVISVFVSVSIIVFLISNLVLGENLYLMLFDTDVTNISIQGVYNDYEFSLLDRLPFLFLLGGIFLIVFLFILFRTDKFIFYLKSFFLFVKNYIVDTYQIIKGSNVKYFLLLSFLTTVYLAYNYPLTLDEPPTYLEFVKTPFWHAIFLYPYPNNHVFSSFLINLTNEFSFLDILFRIRIPAIIISLLTWVFAYRFVRKFYSENVALFVVAVGTIVVTNVQHAYIARGYAFVMFFVIVALYAAFNIIHRNNKKRDWIAFVVSSALGAWVMPSFLYPFLSISILIFYYNYKAIKQQVLYSMLVGVIVFVLYAPIFIVSGIETLSSNEFINTIGRVEVMKSLPGFILGVFVHIFYMPYYIIIPLLLLPILYSLYRRDKKALILWAIFGITPCLFLVLHSVLPFFRTFFYYGFIAIFLMGVSFRDLIDKVNRRTITLVLLLVQIGGTFFFFRISRGLMPEVFQSSDVIDYILEDDKTYFLSSNISWMQMLNLEFEAERRGYNIQIKGGYDADVMEMPTYDYYLIDVGSDRTSKTIKSVTMPAVFTNPVNIYKKEDLRSR